MTSARTAWPITCLTDFVTSKAGRSSCYEYPTHPSFGRNELGLILLGDDTRNPESTLADLRIRCDIAAPVESDLAAHVTNWMKRFDLLVASALTLMGAFVAREALTTRAHVTAKRTASFGVARVNAAAPVRFESPVPTASPAPSDSGIVPVRRPAVPAPAATNTADVRHRIELGSQDTYINDVIVSHDSALARWPDREGNPLRVWVQPTSRHQDFNAASVPVVRRAFVEWSEVGIPVPFTFVVDSSMADVRVTWVDKFNESISGKTLWAHDEGWWIIDANIQLAVHHHSGEVLDTTSIRAIAMHEVGHLIGLDHTTDTTSIMAPKVRVRDLSAADRATAQLLYKLPAGRLTDSQSARR